ncbi:MAG TPA: arylesterase [Gemmatimonadales bacterium]|nr:arylesterase [Gemmatimonadales bacterium]
MPVVLFVGTSLTAGYGLSPEEAWTAEIQARIDARGWQMRVVNAGVSGETSAGALRRIDWLLGQGTPALVMVETGANDGLRGLSIDALEVNLDSILGKLAAARPRPAIVVAGMEALPNMGTTYVNRFRQVFPRAAQRYRTAYLPFLLDGVAGIARFNQADGIHPNPEGADRVAANVWTALEPVLDSIASAHR